MERRPHEGEFWLPALVVAFAVLYLVLPFLLGTFLLILWPLGVACAVSGTVVLVRRHRCRKFENEMADAVNRLSQAALAKDAYLSRGFIDGLIEDEVRVGRSISEAEALLMMDIEAWSLPGRRRQVSSEVQGSDRNVAAG